MNQKHHLPTSTVRLPSSICLGSFLLAPTSCRDSDMRIKEPDYYFFRISRYSLKNKINFKNFRMQGKYITVHEAYNFKTHRGFAIKNAGLCGIVKSLYGPTSLDPNDPNKNWRINVELIDPRSIHEEIFLRFWISSNDILKFPLICQERLSYYKDVSF